MPLASISTIKSWFENFDRPNQQQFWDWIDSFWHKGESIPTSSITGLDDIISDLPSQAQLDAIDAFAPTVVVVSGAGTFQVPSGKILQYIVCEAASDTTIQIGTTASGSEIQEVALKAASPETLTFNSYVKNSFTIHFTGNFTAIIYLR